jgi:hypothetical protein
MKKILLSLALLTVTYISFAQSSSTIVSIGPEIGQPLGQANKVYNLVYGGSIKVEIPVSHSGLDLTVTAGYDVFKTYSYLSGYIDNGQYIPIELGLKNYIQHSVVFVEGDLGASFDNNDNYTGPKAAFIFAPAIGVSLAKNSLDISVRYEGRVETGGTISQLALRVAAKFGGK